MPASIMVLFLFVIMLLGAERLPGGEAAATGSASLAILLDCRPRGGFWLVHRPAMAADSA